LHGERFVISSRSPAETVHPLCREERKTKKKKKKTKKEKEKKREKTKRKKGVKFFRDLSVLLWGG